MGREQGDPDFCAPPASLPAVPPMTGFATLPAPHLHTRKGKIQGVRGRTFHGPMGTGRGFV